MKLYFKPIQFVRGSSSSSRQPLPDELSSTAVAPKTENTTTVPNTRLPVTAEDIVDIYTSIIGTSREPGAENPNISATQDREISEHQVRDAENGTSGDETLADVETAEKRKRNMHEHDKAEEEEENEDETPLVQRSWKNASKGANQSAEETVWCEDCDLDILKQDHAIHVRGTAHLLSKKGEKIERIPFQRPLGLDETNIGYQLAVKSGWTRDMGLGITEQGIREPIATRLKLDRLGLGNKETGRKAITHTHEDIKKASSVALGKAKRQKTGTSGESSVRVLTGKEVRQQHERDRKKTQAIMEYLKK